MERTILHCDCNGFYASVETLLRPELATVPMAVCGAPENRHGIILAKNELAKRYRIQTAETVWQALEKCPRLVLVPPHHEEYERVSQQVNTIYQRFTDQVEPFGIDESWLDVTGSKQLFGDGLTIANQLRQIVREEVGITISVGVSYNKIFAKLGSDYKKPDATTVISPDNFQQVVWPLPVSNLLYVGRSAEATLRKIYVSTIGDLAGCDRALLRSRLGKLGEQLHDYANGWDASPVRTTEDPREIKSVGNGMTFKRNLLGEGDIHLAVVALADEVAARMRKHQVKCTTVQVIIRDPNFKNISRQMPMEPPTYLASELARTAYTLIKENWKPNQPIRMITITGAGLIPADEAVEQLNLFDAAQGKETRQKREKLEVALDQIRGKYGKTSVAIGGTLHNELGLSQPGEKVPDVPHPFEK